ncbi:hypothetical protein AAF712_011055 [Marasmius tenuissimus]|uniref:Uncharacterized protein n=1 Tax=Marasmius tenuissimus TaxID=585030 RepID=A0ABR2ZK67_9AGAR
MRMHNDNQADQDGGLQLEELSSALLHDDFHDIMDPRENPSDNSKSNKDEDSSGSDSSSNSSDEDNSSNSSSKDSSSDSSSEDERHYGEENMLPPRNVFVEENMDHVCNMMEFIRTYDFKEEKRQLPAEVWDAFMNPPEERVDLSPLVLLSIQYYLILSHASEDTYSWFRKLYNGHHPNAELLSYDQV